MTNICVLMGRLTRDPEVRATADGMIIARFTLAVDRMKEGADFISCVAFGKTAEIMEKHLHKGSKICVTGHIQTGSYENKEGAKVYTTDVIVDRFDFADSKGSTDDQAISTDSNGFMNIPDNIAEKLPFN